MNSANTLSFLYRKYEKVRNRLVLFRPFRSLFVTHDGDFRVYRLIAARTFMRDEKVCPPTPCGTNSSNRITRRTVLSAARPNAVFPLSSTHATAIIVSGHERFCRFSINVIGLEEIDPLIFLSVIATFVTHFLLSIRSRIPSPSVLNKNPPCL